MKIAEYNDLISIQDEMILENLEK